MGGMPEFIAKGAILAQMDAFSINGDLTALRDALLNSPDTMDVIGDAAHFNVLQTSDQVGHMRNDWFWTWWPSEQPVEPIIRRGVIEALNRAISTKLPICFYWVCTPRYDSDATDSSSTDNEPVQVAVAQSPQQITVIFHTPDPPYLPAGVEDDNLTVVKRDAATGQIVVVHPDSNDPAS